MALGIACGALHVEFVKDVQGIYDKDPKTYQDATFYPSLDYDSALDIVHNADHAVLHPRSILLAQKNHLPLFIRSFHSPAESAAGTWIKPQLSVARPLQPLYELEEVLV